MKKILNYSLILFVFCLTFTFGGVFFDLNSTTNAATSNDIEIATSTDLKNYITNYTSTNRFDNIILTADINMANEEALTSCIGTEQSPFSGKFDGRGYTISNLKIDSSVDLSQEGAVVQNNQYAGLFGVVSNATISNVALGGNLEMTTGGCINAYVAGLVAKAEGCTIKHVQITAKIIYNTNFDSNINFGTLVGLANDSNISYVICRNTNGFGNWVFSKNDNKVMTFGGIAGKISNTEISFAVVGVKYNTTFNASFVGDISIGGIVGNVSQGGSKIINVACENSFNNVNNSVSTDAIINIGEIVGAISNPAPESRNISYIHYKSNSSINRFGSMGSYTYQDVSTYDFITYSLDQMTSEAYFDNQVWHPLYGTWDFSQIWYVGSQTIYLQSFYGNFGVRLSNSLNANVLSLTNEIKPEGYRFGEKVEINFVFNDIKDGDTVVGNMKEYYNLSTVVLNGIEIAKIITTNVDGITNYRISGSTLVDIKTLENVENGFALIVKNVNKASSGDYNITTNAKTFVANISSKLYKGNNDGELVVGEVPGYVFYAEGTTTTTENLTLSKMSYGQTYRVETRVKPNTPNSFVGWYLTRTDDTDLELSRNRILEFTFGTGNFKDNCQIYAKYKDNACVVTFKMDGGIAKVDLYSGGVTIESTGETVAVSKEEASLKLEIYIKEGYSFDVNKFIAELDTYKTEDPTKNFCSLRESYETEDGFMYYHFILDMTTLVGDYANAFTINAQTTVETNSNMNWIWYLVGGLGGAVVLGLIIFLIIFFARRNKFGGGSGGGSFKKKNYKNMYY